MGRIKFCVFFIGGLMLLMTSCLGSDDNEVDSWQLGNAQIASFSLSHDSIAGLSNVKFTIDQLNSKIYNRDSMPYGTNINEKVLCSLTYDNSSLGVAGIYFVEQATGDTIWNISDSIDFSAPVLISVFPYDGISTKTYEAKLNIHQVNPDTMVWYKAGNLLSGHTFQDMKVVSDGESYYLYVLESGAYSLYKASLEDVEHWEKQVLSGFPEKAVLEQLIVSAESMYVLSDEGILFRATDGQNWLQEDAVPSLTALLGCLPKNAVTGRAAVLAGIMKEEQTFRFITINDEMEWEAGAVVPETFPLSGFSSLSYELMYHPHLILAAGRDVTNHLSDKAWGTMDGLAWASLTNNQFTFSPREGAALVSYDDNLFVLGGIDADGTALHDIYYTKDKGITWQMDSLYMMPEDYQARGFFSVMVDTRNYMLLFGGKAGKDTQILNELWRGRINRLGFGKD